MGVTYLLDTHTLFWLVDPAYDATPPRVLTALGAPGARRLVSAVSAFEIANKVRLGKFGEAAWLLDQWGDALSGLDSDELVVTTRHGLRAGLLDWGHRDPFDRLLVAQAQVERLTLVTADRAMLAAPGIDVLPW